MLGEQLHYSNPVANRVDCQLLSVILFSGPSPRSILNRNKLLENDDSETSSADNASFANAGPVIT